MGGGRRLRLVFIGWVIFAFRYVGTSALKNFISLFCLLGDIFLKECMLGALGCWITFSSWL
jgi:hypothetical protein